MVISRERGDRRDPAANPAYCYEWCFTQGLLSVFNLWFGNLKIEHGKVVHPVNFRLVQRRVEASEHLDQGTRTAMGKRASRCDRAIRRARETGAPVRVILLDGDRRDLSDPTSLDASRVELRLLDPSPWHVVTYDLWGTTTGGDGLLERDEPIDAG